MSMEKALALAALAKAGKGGSASEVAYSNEASGLIAENVQDAIDEVHEEVEDAITAIGDLADLETEAKSNLVAAINELANEILGINEALGSGVIE